MKADQVLRFSFVETSPKYIKDMSHMDKIKYLSDVEPYFHRGRKNKRFIKEYNIIHNIAKQYCTDFGIKNIDISEEVWDFVNCFAKSLRYNNKKSHYNFRRSSYTLNKCRTKHALGYKKMKRVIIPLIYYGYIQRNIGYYLNKDDCVQSVLEFNDSLLALFNIDRLVKYSEPRTKNEVILRKDKVDIILNNNMKGLKNKRDFLFNYNTELENHTVAVNNIIYNNLIYFSVHEDNLDGAGRIYLRGIFQVLPSKMRDSITIDGELCREGDFTSCQPNILMQLANSDGDPDAYNIPSFVYGNDSERRDFIKLMTMCIFFTKSRRGALRAVRNRLIEDKANIRSLQKFESFHKYLDGGIVRLVDTFISHHSDISHFFFTDKLWSFLQNKDSKIAQYVIQCFIDKGKAILCYHDSFVVKQSDYLFLVEKMKEGWSNVLGGDSRCFINKK